LPFQDEKSSFIVKVSALTYLARKNNTW